MTKNSYKKSISCVYFSNYKIYINIGLHEKR